MSSGTIDPLDLLKEFILNAEKAKQGQVKQTEIKRITLKDGVLCFESPESETLRLPVSTETAWKSKKENEFYTLGSLYLLIMHKDSKISDYTKFCGE